MSTEIETAAIIRAHADALAEAGRLREAIDPIARAYRVSMEPFAPGIDEADGAHHWMPHGWPSVKEFKNANSALTSTPTTAAWLEARDRRNRLLGAAEAFEEMRSQAEQVGKESGLAAKFCRLFASECIERAAQLRREAERE